MSGNAGDYSLTLFVHDFGVPPLNSTAMLYVKVLLTCQQNCLPQWTNPEDQTMTIYLNEVRNFLICKLVYLIFLNIHTIYC